MTLTRTLLIISLFLPRGLPAQAPDGAAIFDRACATCHRAGSGTRAPMPEVLRQVTRENILRSLETGLMKSQGSLLTQAERGAVAVYLGRPPKADQKPAAGSCENPTPWVGQDSGWNGWSVGTSNSRFQPGAVAKLDPANVPRLKLRWAFGFPSGSSINSQPTVFGGSVFVGSEEGTVYSLDARSGCMNWGFKVQATVRAAVVIDPTSRMALFGDLGANVYAVDAQSAKLVWKRQVDTHRAARITGSPLLLGDRLYVPVSSGEEGSAADPRYACCSFRGSIVALDVGTGRQIWKAYTIPDEPRQIGVNRIATPIWGPSGAAVWSPPTADLKRRAIYVGTGNSYSDPPSAFSDAVVAFDIDTGRMLWHQQLAPPDRWNIGCVVKDTTNCPPSPGPDVDFGSPPILCPLRNGRDLLIIPQKSGVVHAIDPDRRGAIVWQTRIGRGGLLGGIEWGGGADQGLAYFPVSDWQDSKPEAGGGLFALRIATGAQVWYAPPPKPACVKLPGCSAALIAPVTVTSGVIFSGSYDGHLRAYNTHDGSLLWDLDTLREFATVNGVNARGGSLGATGPTVAHGMLFLDAGYGAIRGNVLLAFSVDGK